jgi:hypothetical protein
MDPTEQDISELEIAKDRANDEVVLAVGDKMEGFDPDDARELADLYEMAAETGDIPNTSGTREFISTLRRYAFEVENEQYSDGGDGDE